MGLERIKKAIEEEEAKAPEHEVNKVLKETIKVLKEEFGADAAIILPQIVNIGL